MKGLKIMTKLLKTITTIAALATTLITVSIYASAQSPVDNGSNARAEMVQNGLIAGQTAESNAFPGWIAVSYTHLDVYKRQICDCVLRFVPLMMTGAQLNSAHAINENLSVESLERGIVFYHDFIKNYGSEL